MPWSFPYTFGGSDEESTISLTQVTDHAAQAKDRLAEEFRNRPNLAAVLDALNLQTQQVEDSLWQLVTERGMAQAVGTQLDVLGVIVGQDRQGQDDDTYRLFLKARVLLNLSSGTVEDVYRIFAVLTSSTLRIIDSYPAGFTLRLGTLPVDPSAPAQLIKFLRAAKSGGVRAILEWFESDPTLLFRLDSGPGLDVGRLAGGTE